jgi:glyoxylase-like metal-dependent hydrolase (beta-lactamase superfamily II)/rhodanese-related sulfurtransferase
MHIETIETPELGDRSYLISDGVVAVVIDPQRDLERVYKIVADLGVTVRLVCETHRHNDYVTGGYALADATGATYVVPVKEDVAMPRVPVVDGEVIDVGSLRVTVVETPGHTEGHAAYIVGERDGGTPAVFTGGSLLFGSVGRTDLIAPERTRPLAHAQYHSARRLAQLAPDDAVIYPTHGFGSFCSSGPAIVEDSSTIGAERRRNAVFVARSEDAFVDDLVAGLTAYPAYYAQMAALHSEGRPAADLSEPAPVDASELARRLHAGEWVVDLRARRAFAASHISGTLGFELSNSFATYLGWLIPWGTPITFLGADAEQVRAAQRQLALIGIDRPAGATTEPVADLAGDTGLRSYPVATFADLADAGDILVLDVRRVDEVATGRLPGALNIPLPELRGRLGEVPAGKPVWVHCLSGYRASIAASLLDAAGLDVVLVDDDLENVPADSLT